MDENKQEGPQATQPIDMDDFEAGFNDGMEPDTNADNAEAAASVENLDTFEAPEQEQPEAPVQVMSEQTAPAPAVQAAPPAMPQAPLVAQIAQVAPVEISAAIAEEFGELARLSPKAAELAREDSPEGAAIRDRLERVGADSAFDRAEVLLERRDRAAQAAHAQQQAVEAHNRNFQQILHTEHPDLFTQERTPEQNQQFMADVRSWIEAKPYAEARGLMEIYEGGRDPRQVSGLLTRFKQEAGTTGTPGATGATGTGIGKKTTVDHTAALAVAGRGAPIVPKAVGDKDDFETGWNL